MNDKPAGNFEEPDSKPGRNHTAAPGILPERLPEPTLWPAVLALGSCFLAWGILTSWLMSAAGAVLFIMGCAGWVGDLRGVKNK